MNLELLKNLAYSIMISLVGCLLTVMFATLIFSLESLSVAAPCLLAFNAAMAGYSVVEKNRNIAKRLHLFGMTCGLLTAVLSFVILDIIFVYTKGGIIFDLLDLSIFVGVGIAFAELGVLLAIKYFSAQASAPRDGTNGAGVADK